MTKFNELKFKKDKLARIRELLAGTDEINIEANLRGLLRIYQLQTISEQTIEFTSDENGVGFTGFDGEFLTSLAKQFIESGSLSAKQFISLKKSMKKYAGQLLKIATGQITDCEIDALIPQRPVSQWVRTNTTSVNFRKYTYMY